MEVGLGKRSARLLVASGPDAETLERPKRIRWAADVAPEPDAQQDSAAKRPTWAERAAAQSIITAMRDAAVLPPILKKNAPADPAVVACSLAIHFKQQFSSSSGAKEAFGVSRTTDVDGRWVHGKLAKLSQVDPAALAAVASVFLTPVSVPEAAPEAAAAAVEAEDVAEELACEQTPPPKEPGESDEVSPNYHDVEEHLHLYMLMIEEGVKEYKSRKHLPLWSKKQRDTWRTFPNPYISGDSDYWPQPSMTVINNDFRAAQLLPHAQKVIEVLLRLGRAAEDEAERTSQMLDRALLLLSEHGIQLSESSNEEESEEEREEESGTEAQVGTPEQLERAERLKYTMLGMAPPAA